jgi:2-methylaconitate cis-trans-isomerase PrpF
MADYKIPCVIMRGGTSKGVFIEKRFLPDDPKKRDAIILSIFGSPDKRQIDGLGGADPLTSKLAIISPSSSEDADVDYTFGQIGINAPTINYSINCGNISAAVGPFAIDEGMVKAAEPYTTVRIFNTNTKKLIIAEVPVKDNRAMTSGNYKIHGVPGTGAEIRLTFCDPAGAVTGYLLPTRRPLDNIVLEDGKKINISLVDAGTLYTFIPADEIGLTGAERPEDIEERKTVMEEVEEIRRMMAKLLVEMGIISPALGGALSTSLKIAIVGKPVEYVTESGQGLKKGDINLVSRIINPGKVHKAFAVTGAICVATAAFLEGTIVNKVVKKDAAFESKKIRIGHPYGSIDAEVDYEYINGGFLLKGTKIKMTARRIMDGFAYVPVDFLNRVNP